MDQERETGLLSLKMTDKRSVSAHFSGGKTTLVRRKSVLSLSGNLFLRVVRVFLITFILYGLFLHHASEPVLFFLEMVFFFVLNMDLYMGMWYEGEQDKNFVLFNNMRHDRWRGLKVGVLLSLPFWLLFGFLLLAKGENSQSMFTFYQWISLDHQFLASLILPSGYIADAHALQLALFAGIPILIILVVLWGYTFGYQGQKVSRLFSSEGWKGKKV